MKTYHDIAIEKKFGKYIFSKEFSFKKRKNKTKSPLSNTASDSPKSDNDNHYHKSKKSLDFKNNNDPFLFESNLDIDDNPFLSSINKCHHFTMNLPSEQFINSYMKVRSKITLNENISNFLENDFVPKFTFNNNSKSLFSNPILNEEIFYNDGLNTYTNSDLNKKNNCNEMIINEEKKINNESKEIKDDSSNKDNTLINISEKDNIVIEALKALDKDYYKEKKEEKELNLELKELDFEKIFIKEEKSNIINEIDELNEKKIIFELIDKRIKQYYNYYKKNKTYKLNENKEVIVKFKTEIQNSLVLELTNEKYLFLNFKSIVISLYNLVINWLSNSHFQIYLNRIREKNISYENNNIYLDIFIELMDKYNTIKDICPFLEKDFKEIIDNFQNKKKIKFCICELLTDLYWDYIFKIHEINKIFTTGYTVNNIKKNIIFEEAKHAMKSIIDILIVYDVSYKKNIGEILNLPYMEKENIFLMTYIIKYKKNANPFVITNPCIDKNTDKKLENKDIEGINNKTKKNVENKNTENFSLEEVYKYIQGDSDSKKGKKKNKKRQKKKRNKNEDNESKEINIENNNYDGNYYDEVDPVVEEFIQYFENFNKNKTDCVKIKPKISQDWIKSIS